MDALRRLSWPNVIPINRRQTSQHLQSNPNSPISKSYSVQGLVIQIEAKQERHHRRLLEEAEPHSPTCRSVIPHAASKYSRTTSPVIDVKQVVQMAPSELANYEGDSNLGSSAQLPTLPEGLGRDIDRKSVETPPISRLSRTVDSAADDSEDLTSIPDTPTGYARFGFISRESFNTVVRDLVQESPDTPIGGDGVAPTKRSFNVGTLAMDGSRTYLDAPQIEISSPPNALEYEDEKKKALRSRSNFSDPFQESCESKVQPHTSASFPTMITASQSPRADRINNQTSLSLDGPVGGTDVRDFAQQPDLHPLPDCCVSPKSLVSESYVFASPTIGARVAKENLPGLPAPVVDPVPIIIDELGTDKRNPLALPQVPVVIEELNIQRPNALNSLVGAVGIPKDATGQLAPPATPPRRGKRGKVLIRKGQKVFRKGRRVILTRPVLAVVIGRQLSGPTAQALKLISNGVPLDLSNLPSSAAPVPALPIPS